VCSQYRRSQMPRSPRLVMTGDCGSPMGNDFANAVLIARQRPGKLAKDDPGVDMERWTGAHLPNRVAQRVDARHSKFDRRSSRFTVKKNVPPGTRLPDLGERRNALRGWARILQG